MVFQDLLTNKDDYLRASRALLREIIKQTKHEINFQSFCFGLMQERKEPSYVDMEFKVRLFKIPQSFQMHFCCVYFWLLYFSLRSVLLSRWQIYWPSPWCWVSLLRSRKPALRGTKERRRVSTILFRLVFVPSVLMVSFALITMSGLLQIWRSWGRFRIRLLLSKETLCGGCTPLFLQSAKLAQKIMSTGL